MVKKAVYSVVLLILISCQSFYTEKDHYRSIEKSLKSGDYEWAISQYINIKNDVLIEKDKVLYYLELGMLQHFNRDYIGSNESLESAELYIEELQKVSISKGILSGIVNDNALDYPGEDYEDIYINIFKCLNYLQMEKHDEALVEIRRVNDKLNFLEDKYSSSIESLSRDESINIKTGSRNFYNSAMARYLGIIGYRIDGERDSARIEAEHFESAYRSQKSVYNFDKPFTPDFDDSGVNLNILTFTGLAPEKKPETLRVVSGYRGVDIIYDRYDSDEVDAFLGFSSVATSVGSGVNLKIETPRITRRKSTVKTIEVFIDGAYTGDVELIEDFDNIAIETFKLKQPLIVGKTIIRALAKLAVKEGAEDLVKDRYGRDLGLLVDLVGSIYMEASENSDLRTARFFPSKISGKEIKIDEGVYNISLHYLNRRGRIIYKDEFPDFSVKKNQVNLIESFYLW